MRTSPLALLPLLAALAGCADTGGTAPSLAPRAIERAGFAEPDRPVAVATPDAALDADIARRVAAFDAAAAAFDDAVRTIEPRIARGARAAEGSDAWLDAQGAVGELGQARAGVDAAFATLEELAIVRAAALAPPYSALDAAIGGAQARSDVVDAADARLRALLPG